MAELSLRERLQPALLDRLADDERYLTIFQIESSRAELARLKLAEREWLDILFAQGLRPVEDGDRGAVAHGEDKLHWRLFVPSGRLSPGSLKALVLKPPGAPQGVAVQDFCRIETHNVPNAMIESSQHRAVSMRRLRECVLRDVAALLNALNLETHVDLERYPHVQRSVLNYGMRSLAGLSAAAVDPVKTAAGIEEAIRRYEPRLRKVHVAPETREGAQDGHQLAFRIDAELWGQPVPQQLVLRTRIETDTGNATVSDAGAG
ncbi:MAG TPA: type VI secretion system baseplate subunit TssE [Steroidobacteraceae bacterium]|nr:type VI secretion system baseplate subunit TssE [Steroidobacteraceae bacterium]HEV2441897.1 type VI secretion system baseplate subunit TssE [Steroidobacteraceae bacterium]